MITDIPPYDQIDEIGDRSWTLRLVERLTLPDLSEDERDQIVWVVERLVDPRAVKPLTDILEDRTLPKEIRQAAAQILRARDTHREQCLAYWRDGDDVLREFALWQMDKSSIDIINRIAADPVHPLHRVAIARLIFQGEYPHQQQLVINALKHRDPSVRGTAATALLWSEAIVGEEPLIEATADSDLEVVDGALAALEYYRSQHVLMHMHYLSLNHIDEAARATAAAAYTSIRDDFANQIQHSPNRDHLIRWLAPIWDVLAFAPDELMDKEYPPFTPSDDSKQTINRADVETVINNPDAPLDKLRRLFNDSDWQSIHASDRPVLIERLIHHGDPETRSYATKALCAWDAYHALITLLHDPEFIVRKSAMYSLSMTTPRTEIAAIVWDYMQGWLINSTHASESLETYITHAERGEAIRRLFALADDPAQPEVLRYNAIYDLTKWAATNELAQLMRHLSEPPSVTWSVHTALLDAAAKHYLPTPDLAPLRAVDDLWVQVALAPLVTPNIRQ